MKNEFDLTGRSALVTGSTKGIGAALAVALETAGARVTRHGHPTESVENAILQDLLEPDASVRLMEKLEDSPGLLVCNAGSFFFSLSTHHSSQRANL